MTNESKAKVFLDRTTSEIKKYINSQKFPKKRQKSVIAEIEFLKKCFAKIGFQKSLPAIKAMRRYFDIGRTEDYSVDLNFVDFLMKNKIVSGKTVIDLGCGNGGILKGFSKKYGKKTAGIELSPSFVLHADPSLNLHVGLIDFNAKAFSKSCLKSVWSKKYDSVITTLTMDRVRDQKQLLENILFLVKPGGNFVIGTLLPVISNDARFTKKVIVYADKKETLTKGKTADEDKNLIIEYFKKHFKQDVEVMKFNYKQDINLNDFYIIYGKKNKKRGR